MKNKLDTEKEREALQRISLQVWKEAENSKLAKEAISIAQKCILKVECQKEYIKRLEGKRDPEKCKNCGWWTKQEASIQGKCERCGFYTTGEQFCAGWKEREEEIKRTLEKLPSEQSEIIQCKNCKNHIDDRCIVANHHTGDRENCMTVFGAKRIGEKNEANRC